MSGYFYKKRKVTPTNGFVYAIEFEDGIKIGRTRNIATRLKEYTRPWNKKILAHASFEVPQAAKLEKLLRKRYSSYVCKGSYEYLVGISYLEVVKFIEEVNKVKNNENST